MKRRYVLLKLKPQVDDLYLIIGEPGVCEHPCEGGCDFCRHLYEEKLCTSEFLKHSVQMVAPGNDDPHFMFEFVAIAEAEGTENLPDHFRDVLGEPVDGVQPEGFSEN